MKIDRGVRGWSWSIWPVLIVAGLAAGGLAVGCSSSSKQPPTIQCLLASDCKDPTKQCIQNYCVSMCSTSQDCPSGQRCVKYAETVGAGGAGGGAGDSGLGGAGGMSAPATTVTTGNICQVPEVKTCSMNSDCTPGLFCAKDLQCRNQCNDYRDCLGGVSTATPPVCTTSHFCVDPVADASNYDPTTMDFKPGAGTTGTGGGGGATAGSGGNGGAGTGSGGKGGAGGRPVSGCSSPQTAFTNIAQGDANAFFTAGVGARVAGRLLIFTTYAGPPVALPGGASGTMGAGGAGGASATANYIYVQSFDAVSGVAMGAAAPLVQIADGTNLYLHNVAVSSLGEIVLLHGTGPVNANNTQLYATFLTSQNGGVQFERTVLIESIQFGDVSVVWSEANQQFVLSWKNSANSWQLRTKKFQSGGTPAGGDTNAVPNPTGQNDTGYSFGVGVSGPLYVVAYRNAADGHPYLTLLDPTGNMVGAFTEVSKDNFGPWINVGGTAKGFSVLYQNGNTAYEYFIPKTEDGTGIQVPSGAGGAGGAGGGVVWPSFTVSSTATVGAETFTVGDELGAGGVGTVYLENNGASFLYVTADGAKHFAVGTVISSSKGSQVAITNYGGSFSVSLFEAMQHATQVVASGCTQ